MFPLWLILELKMFRMDNRWDSVLQTVQRVTRLHFSELLSTKGTEKGPRVWRKRGEAHNPHFLRSSVKFPQSVMVWGAMSSAGVGPLCFLRSKVNAAVYQEVLEHFMFSAAYQLYGDADFIFQQDLAPAHSAKATSTW
uniref:Tc1-like transposase DDE domain-containing protein n=1 Tax=Cyprinus carpio carpio TaxID=630221 RepID=A0A9J7YS10_CYPCA